MGGAFQYADIIILALIAGFIALRLRSVLGRRTGHEEAPQDVLSRRAAAQPDPVPLARPAEALTPLDATLAKIRQIDSGFDPGKFASSAKAAYQIILDAFWKGDKDELRALLSDGVYNNFAAAIDARPADAKSLANKIVSIDSATITEAELEGSQADIIVRFLAELDEPGADLRRVNDVWTFSRDLKSRNPNWYLIATASGE